MSEAKFIRLRPENPGLNYVWLTTRGQKIIQRLAGEVWTDYNEHDPGVTTLEQLCYALTELSYRAHLPIEDLLTARESEGIDGRRQGLFAPSAILPCGPLTERDYRKLIVDRVSGVANAWLRPCRAASRVGASGLHDIELYAPDHDQASAKALRRAVRRLYTKRRSLCEDVHAVRVLKHETAELDATVTLDEAHAAEVVLASLFYRLGCVLAPEPRRQSLQELLDSGQTPATIFTGPALRNGFISDDQLEDRPTEFTIGQLTQTIVATEGVIGVRHLSLATGDACIEAGGQTTLVVPPWSILRLDTQPVGDRFRVRLMRRGVECIPDADRVRRELERLWFEHRRTHDILAESDRLLAIPRGRYVDVGAYSSIQEQFPTVYGINRYGVAGEATPERRGQARQFKAYLLVFEQLLADSFARLGGLKNLCAIDRAPGLRAFQQYLDACDDSGASLVPDVKPLLDDSYRKKLPRLTEHRDRLLERRNRFLDFMLATYGEALEPVVQPSVWRDGAHGSASRERIRAKLHLLRHLTRVGRDRGTGWNYLAKRPSRQVAGLEFKTRLQLGMDVVTPPPLADLLEDLHVELQDAPSDEEFARMRQHGSHIDARFRPMRLSAIRRRPALPGGPKVTMSEELLVAAADIENFRVGNLPGDTHFTLVCRAPFQPAWQFVGRYELEESALADVVVWQRRASTLRQKARRLFILEHVLLRGGRAPRADDEDARFDYSLTASAVVCLPGREANDEGYRRHVHSVIRANTPAHVLLNTHFMRLRDVTRFEELHARWREMLATGRDRPGLDTACRDLREFLLPQ